MDETFLARMMSVLQDVSTGYLLLEVEVEALEAFLGHYPLPARPDAMPKVRKQIPALAARVDFWWQWVGRDLEPFVLSPSWRQWVYACLLPIVYWDRQGARTRCRRRKARGQRALAEVQATFTTHAMTQRLSPQGLAAWQAWATDQVKAFQRTSAAVEGRNGSLAQLHHNQRGLPKQRYQVWTALHNFNCRAADGTTPAARFFRRSVPDLFETVLAHIGVLPRSRQRKRAVVLSH